MFVKLELSYGGTIMVNPEYVAYLESDRDGTKVWIILGTEKRGYSVKGDINDVAAALSRNSVWKSLEDWRAGE